MNPQKVVRENVKLLTDLPNIGKASAMDLQLLGIHTPKDLIGRCPFEMYNSLCQMVILPFLTAVKSRGYAAKLDHSVVLFDKNYITNKTE